MKRLLSISIFCLVVISMHAQRKGIIKQELCWNTGSVDSSVTRYILASTKATEVKLLTYLNASGQKVDVSGGGSFSHGHCGCCGVGSGSSGGDGQSLVNAKNGLSLEGDSVILGGILKMNTTIAGMDTYGLDLTTLSYLTLSGKDSLRLITPDLLSAVADIGGVLQLNSATGRVQYTPYAFPLVIGSNGQYMEWDAVGDSLKWTSPYITVVATDSSYRFSVNGSSTSEVLFKNIYTYNDTLTSNRTAYLDGKRLVFYDTGNGYFQLVTNRDIGMFSIKKPSATDSLVIKFDYSIGGDYGLFIEGPTGLRELVSGVDTTMSIGSGFSSILLNADALEAETNSVPTLVTIDPITEKLRKISSNDIGQQTVYMMPGNGLYRAPFLEEVQQYLTDSSITLNEGDLVRYTQDSIIFHSRDTILNNSSYNAFPAFAVTKTGKLIVGYMAATEHGVKDSPIAMRSSTDGGKSWSEPDTLFRTDVTKERGNIHDIFVAENNDIYSHISYQDSTIIAEYNSIIIKSVDDGESWTTIDTLPDFGGVGTFLTSFLVLPNGDWVAGYYITGFSAGFAWSSDEGKNWTNALYSSQSGLNLNEQLIRPISDDTLMTLIRGEGNTIYTSRSGDGGRTWSAVSNTGLTGQKRCFPYWAKLSTGEIYLNARELAGDSEHYVVAISEDDGETWSDWLEVDSTNSLMYGVFQEVSPKNLFGVYSIEYGTTDSDLYFHRMSSVKKAVTLEYTYLNGELVQTGFDFEQPFEDNTNPVLVAKQYTTTDTLIDLSRHAVITLNERSTIGLDFHNIDPGVLRALHIIDADSTNTVFYDSVYCYEAGQRIHIDAIKGSYAGTLFSDQDSTVYLTPCPPDFDYTPATVTPATYSPFAWYDAGRESYSNGATVDTITDQSGNNRHFISAGSAEPVFATGSFEGESSYYFNANTDYATISNSGGDWDFLHDAEATVFLIAQIGGSSNPDSLMMVFGPTTTSLAGAYIGLDDRSGSSRNNAVFFGANNGTPGQTAFAITQNDSLTAGQFNYIQYKSDADNGTAADRLLIRVNEGPEWGTNSSTNTPGGTYATLRLGSDSGGSFGAVMKICEMVIYNSVLTPAQIVNLRRDYFGPKYNLSLE